jgi:hypothetical protein
MTIETVVERLASLPEDLWEAERAVLDAEAARVEAQARLEDVEADLLLDPERINGKNAEQRQAQLRSLTATERAAVEERALEAARLKVSLHQLQAEHAGLRAIARLLAAERD